MGKKGPTRVLAGSENMCEIPKAKASVAHRGNDREFNVTEAKVGREEVSARSRRANTGHGWTTNAPPAPPALRSGLGLAPHAHPGAALSRLLAGLAHHKSPPFFVSCLSTPHLGWSALRCSPQAAQRLGSLVLTLSRCPSLFPSTPLFSAH